MKEKNANRFALDTDQKALEINLDEYIYGTFAEIGAGQEVARYFFKVGAAARTIAKTMSAYDKTFSDKIYGEEPSNRYVCESRVNKMLDHEYSLMEERLQYVKPDTNFFVFADSVSSLNYEKSNIGHGWLGLRFQLHPDQEPNDLIIHARMLDTDAQLQHRAIGILGVNMVYACFRHHSDPDDFVRSLCDHLKGRMTVDMISISGPEFEQWDNRVMSLKLVEHDLSQVAMFGSKGQSLHPSETMYRNALLVVRGNYRPPTIVSLDVFNSSYQQFLSELQVNESKATVVAELTLDSLDKEDRTQDFIQRADMLCAMEKTTIISNCRNHESLIAYLSDFKVPHVAIVIGVYELANLITEYYEKNKDGNLLAAFGELFSNNSKIYAYPALDLDSNEVITKENLPLPDGIRFLYKHLIDRHHIIDVDGYNDQILHIFPHQVLEQISDGNQGWENLLPDGLAEIIKENEYFHFTPEKVR